MVELQYLLLRYLLLHGASSLPITTTSADTWCIISKAITTINGTTWYVFPTYHPICYGTVNDGWCHPHGDQVAENLRQEIRGNSVVPACWLVSVNKKKNVTIPCLLSVKITHATQLVKSVAQLFRGVWVKNAQVKTIYILKVFVTMCGYFSATDTEWHSHLKYIMHFKGYPRYAIRGTALASGWEKS